MTSPWPRGGLKDDGDIGSVEESHLSVFFRNEKPGRILGQTKKTFRIHGRKKMFWENDDDDDDDDDDDCD